MRKLFKHILFIYLLIVLMAFIPKAFSGDEYAFNPIALIISLLVLYYLLSRNYFTLKNLKYGCLIFIFFILLGYLIFET
tara:strand:+ start:2701 stop:2937 length:237 start_codon:yes stop_codon:yes gene_type:complete